MTLEQILHGVKLRGELSGDLRGMEVRGLEYDSRRVEQAFCSSLSQERAPTAASLPSTRSTRVRLPW